MEMALSYQIFHYPIYGSRFFGLSIRIGKTSFVSTGQLIQIVRKLSYVARPHAERLLEV